MPTPIYPQQQGATQWATASGLGSSVANNAINTANGIRLQRSSFGSGAMTFDVRLTGSFGTDPAGAGSLQLLVIDRDFGGTAGPTPSTTGPITGRTYAFSPQPTTNATKIFSINNIPLPYDCDVYIYNVGTGYTFTFQNAMNSSADALAIMAMSPGT